MKIDGEFHEFKTNFTNWALISRVAGLKLLHQVASNNQFALSKLYPLLPMKIA